MQISEKSHLTVQFLNITEEGGRGEGMMEEEEEKEEKKELVLMQVGDHSYSHTFLVGMNCQCFWKSV